MATRTKTKAAASRVAIPQSRTECAEFIHTLGNLQRDFERQRLEMNDSIAEITKRHQPELEALQARIDAQREGIQTWCEANRVLLCGEGDKLGKTANLQTGEVSWRLRPHSVNIRGVESVVEALQRIGLGRFVRVKAEPNKEAMLNEPDAVRGIAGISIVTGVEDFIVAPFEAKADA